MSTNEISFENLPKAVAHLVSEPAKIESLVEKKGKIYKIEYDSSI